MTQHCTVVTSQGVAQFPRPWKSDLGILLHHLLRFEKTAHLCNSHQMSYNLEDGVWAAGATQYLVLTGEAPQCINNKVQLNHALGFVVQICVENVE